MKITKFNHSCLLVEEGGRRALFDPGIFSKELLFTAFDAIDRLDYLIITHNHSDHLDEELAAKIAGKWPEVKLAANQQIKDQLKELNLPETDDNCRPFSAPHESLPTGRPPANSGWHFAGLSHPGDSLSFTETESILALPYVAPWGSTTRAVELAKKLKPKIVVPIHDWHLSAEGRLWYQELLSHTLAKEDIEFVNLPLGQSVKINA